MGTGSFPGVESGRGVTLTPYPLPVPWSWKSRAIHLLPLWGVQPVQSLSACKRSALFLLLYIQCSRISLRVRLLESFPGQCSFVLVRVTCRWWWWRSRALVESYRKGKTEVLLEKNSSQSQFVYHASHMGWPGIELKPQWWESGD